MNRKDFIKSSCQLCLLGAAGMFSATLLSSCGAAKTAAYRVPVLDGRISVPLAVLEADGSKVIRPQSWDYDIAIHKNEGRYEALLLRCTHMENPLYPSGKGWVCHQHGSVFDAEGRVRKGPAEKSLTRYRTEVEGENLLIYIS